MFSTLASALLVFLVVFGQFDFLGGGGMSIKQAGDRGCIRYGGVLYGAGSKELSDAAVPAAAACILASDPIAAYDFVVLAQKDGGRNPPSLSSLFKFGSLASRLVPTPVWDMSLSAWNLDMACMALALAKVLTVLLVILPTLFGLISCGQCCGVGILGKFFHLVIFGALTAAAVLLSGRMSPQFYAAMVAAIFPVFFNESTSKNTQKAQEEEEEDDDE